MQTFVTCLTTIYIYVYTHVLFTIETFVETINVWKMRQVANDCKFERKKVGSCYGRLKSDRD